MISLIQLEYILALDTYRHFATAAEKCFVTQPTLSMQVKKLEEYLGVVLFDRTKQPVIPTEQGKRIIEQARIVLQESAKITLIVDEVLKEIKGDLRIGLIPTIAPYLLPLFTGTFKKAYPNVHLKIDEVVTEQIEYMLSKDLLDVGILVTPLNNSQVIEQPLYYEEMMIYHNKSHPLANQKMVALDEINPLEIWLLGDGHCFRNQVINFCDIQKLHSSELPFEFDGGSLHTLMKIIDKEGGYTLIPELAALEVKDSNQVKRFSTMTPLREVSLVYTRKFAKTQMLEAIVESVKNAVPEIMLDEKRGKTVEWK